MKKEMKTNKRKQAETTEEINSMWASLKRNALEATKDPETINTEERLEPKNTKFGLFETPSLLKDSFAT